MDYEWLYERLEPYYCHGNGKSRHRSVCAYQDGTHSAFIWNTVFGRPTRESGYALLPLVFRLWAAGSYSHFATVSYAFCQRFPDEVTSEMLSIFSTKHRTTTECWTPAQFSLTAPHQSQRQQKKFQKEQVLKAARSTLVRTQRVNEGRKAGQRSPLKMRMMKTIPREWRLWETMKKTVSTTDPDCGMFVKRRTRTANFACKHIQPATSTALCFRC